jgi:NAD-dependent dihydropyrimidine dehydrogenase PreA subunit
MGMVYLKNVATLELDGSLCNGCGRCLEVCPQEVFVPHGKRVRISDRDRCIECGACAINCAPGAIKVNSGVGCASAFIHSAIKKSDTVCCGPEGCC